MSRFLIEHLPRNPATYRVHPLDFSQAKAWIDQPNFHSLIRTTELIAAIQAGMGVSLAQADSSMSLRPGDEAVLISLSFGVLLASAEGNIPPLAADWRCSLLLVEAPPAELTTSLAEQTAQDLSPRTFTPLRG